VVGGGAVGTSVAYHLAARGAGRVVLLERARSLGTGSTGKCAGGFRQQFSSPINIELSKASVPMILEFSEEHGIPLDIDQDGYLFLVRSDRSWDRYVAAAELQRSMGVNVELLPPEGAAELAPGISLDGVVGAVFGPDDGIADPSGLTLGYARAARRAGAEIRLGAAVVSVDVDGGRVSGVTTRDGVVSGPVVVNAAGPWAGKVAETAGVHLPLEPIPRQVVVTGPFAGVPERRTLVIDADSSFYFHREGAGVLMGMGARDEHASFEERVDDRFVAEELLPTAVRVFPPVSGADVVHQWCGLYEMTPDRHPIIGETSGVAGFYLANGFSGHGFQHAPVVGKLLAEIVLDGRASTVDVSALGLDRFERGELIVEGHVV
jgi:sarcosine oxidase subunit beta